MWRALRAVRISDLAQVRWYRALQLIGVVMPLLASALTFYGVALTQRAAETNPAMAALLAPGARSWGGALAFSLVRLILITSVIGQTEYCWRFGARVAGLRRFGWAVLLIWVAAASVDCLHDLSVTLSLI